jgi:protein TonB
MKRILVSALAAVLFHGAVLFFLPFSDFVPGTVSPEDHGIAIQITHLPPEPEKKAGPLPAADLPPVPRPEEQPPPSRQQPPEEKPSSEEKPFPEEEHPPAPVPDIETPLPETPLPKPDKPETDTADPDTADSDMTDPDMPDAVNPIPETSDRPFSDTRNPPPRKILDQNASETGTAQGAAGGMTASIDKTLDAVPPNDGDTASDQPPRKQAVPLYKKNPPPRYPGNARRRGHAGTVLLMVYVTEKGEAGQVRVFESSGHASLDRAAEKAVADWRFEPGTSDGVPTGMWVKIPILFELKP